MYATDRDRIVIIILLVNLFCSAAVFVYGFFQPRGRRATVWIHSALIFFCPPVMAIYTLISRVMDYFLLQNEVDMNDISFNKTRENTVIQPDQDAEMNYVSIHDAIRLSDNRQLRHLLIDVLKYKQGSALSSLYGAMESGDTEAAHYAASAIQDALNDFRLTVQKMMAQLQNNPDDVKLNIDILTYMYRQLKLGILMDSEKQTYAYIANKVAENLYSHNVWFMLPEHYLWITDLMIDISAMDEAEKWVSRAVSNRKDELATYKAELKLYFAQKNSEAFSRCLNEFKQSSIQADQDMLNLIRLYM